MKNGYDKISDVLCGMTLLILACFVFTALQLLIILNDIDSLENPYIEGATQGVRIKFESNVPDYIPFENGFLYVGEEEKEEPTQEKNERYSGINVTEEDIDLMACIVFLESNTETFAGQRMVAEVILNRVIQGDMGGSTINDVVYARNQFSTAKNVSMAKPTEENYAAVYSALYETPITDEDVVFFARSPHNEKIFCKIGGHYFCYR